MLIDDGLATGLTMLAAIHEIKHHKPNSVCVAIPVAPPNAVKSLARHCQIICLTIAEDFNFVGQFYKHFNQVTTEEANKVLKEINK